MTDVRLLYIAGYGRSGSTLLDTLIGNCRNYWGIGEASNLFDAIANDDPCSCGDRLTLCCYWRKVLADIDIDQLRWEQRRAEGVFGALYFRRCRKYKEFWARLLSDCQRAGICLVDSSKISRKTILRPINLRRLGAKVTIVHLFRDSRSLLSSLSKGSNKDLESGVTKTGTSHLFLMRSFVGAFFANLGAILVGRIFLKNYIFIRYEEIVQRPIQVLSKLGIVVDESLDTDHLLPGHAVSGNRMRRAGPTIAIRPDGIATQREMPAVPAFYVRLYDLLMIFST